MVKNIAKGNDEGRKAKKHRTYTQQHLLCTSGRLVKLVRSLKISNSPTTGFINCFPIPDDRLHTCDRRTRSNLQQTYTR